MKGLKFALGLFLLALFTASLVSAANIVGISPGTVYFKEVLRGGYAERYITVTIDSEGAVNVETEARGDIAEWLEFSSNISVSRGHPGRLFISVRPPIDVPNGNYTGFIRVSTGALGDLPPGKAVSAVRAVIDVAVTVEITDLEVLSCRARSFKVHSAEKGDDVVFEVDVFNEGNVRLKPFFIAEIWDQEQISLVKTVEFTGDEILPTKEESLSFYMPTDDMELGQYWVDIEVPDCYSSNTLTFDVLEPGALKAEGLLLRILSPAWAETDETIPLVAEFKNIGEKEVDAKFKGKITRDGEIVQLLESESALAPISEITNFTFFFTPKKAGRYIASGRVFYDKKRTFESSAVINVKPKMFGLKQAALTLVYIVLMIAIIILFYKIRKEKRRYLGKVRKIKYG
ncbi:MAG: hypothetical protein ABIH92_05820 [Nanoarchaeota archaeon]